MTTSARLAEQPAETVDEPPPRRDVVVVLTRLVLPMLLFGGVLVALTRWSARPLSNFDTYFHLRFGHEFLDGWSLRHPGSVTSFATADWVPTQWLPQVVMARTEDVLGLSGVAWLAGAQFLALTLALYVAARKVAEPVVVAPLLIVAVIGCTSGLSMRPQVLSYLLVVVTFAVWRRAHRDDRVPWLLVPLTWVWAMCHGMWPLGVVIGLAAVTGIALDRRSCGRGLAAHAAVPVLSLAVGGLLTPVGPALLPAVLMVNSRGDYFSEWAPPDFTQPQPLLVLAMICLSIFLLARRTGVDHFTIVLVGLALAFAVYSQRTVPVASCLIMPLVAGELQRVLGARGPVGRVERTVVLGGPVAALVVLALLVPRTADEPPPQPDWMDPAMAQLAPGTKVVSETSFGGYLMWRYPDLDFLFSGYGDIYTDDELAASARVESLDAGWDGVLRDAEADWAVLDPRSRLAYALRQDGWSVLHDDGEVQLLERPAS